MFPKLSRHIRTVHKSNTRVKQVMGLPRQNRIAAFQKIRREGIVLYNKEEAKKDIPIYQGERKRRKYKQLLLCSLCSAFISRRFYGSHRRLCRKRHDSPAIGIPLYLQEMNVSSSKLSRTFIRNVLGKMRDDDIGKIVRSQELIIYLGDKFFRKNGHKVSKLPGVMKKVRSDMRQLATLYNAFSLRDGVVKTHGDFMDLLCRENFDHLCDAIDDITLGEGNTVKGGARLGLYYNLLKSSKKIRDKLFLEKRDNQHSEMNKFYEFLKSNEDMIVRNARYTLDNNSLKKARRPSSLPLEEDIGAMHAFIIRRMEELTQEFIFWCPANYIELRNIVLTRLTLLNARR